MTTDNKKTIYLDNAATSFPKPECVITRIEEVLRHIGGNPGRGGHRMAIDAGRVIFRTRESLARLLNVQDASRIVFTKSATEATNLVIKGLLSTEDHAVVSSFEHNAGIKPLAWLERQGMRLTRIKPGKDGRPDLITLEEVISSLTSDTRLVSIVHGSNVFGTIQPIAEIGRALRERGVLFMVDAAQTLGAVPVDLSETPVDILVGTGHKSLFGPQGTGFVYLREGVEPRNLLEGGTGDLEDELETPDRFETGTVNTPGLGGLGAGVDFVLSEGIGKIRAYEEKLIGLLIEGLRKITGVTILGPLDASERTSLVAFNIEGLEPQDIGLRLEDDFDIMVRCGTHCAPSAHRTAGTYPTGAVRVSPGYFNTVADIEALLDAISTIVKPPAVGQSPKGG
ncbi:Cysteine desulfurase [hydrothermal vent metagenome]|uniref:cysteine desulfurase n=1 Tax=hydrothermal vent metagenome TaxID=652676 RepID=A0A3B0QMA5_9ZZZZ